jgi:hypothetical protein
MTNTTPKVAPSKACREDRHANCTGRATQGNRVTYSTSQLCPCDCHDHTGQRAAFARYVALHGYQVPRPA